jgi:hypothetical protein
MGAEEAKSGDNVVERTGRFSTTEEFVDFYSPDPYKENQKLLEKLGLKFEYDRTTNVKEVLERVYTKKEIKEALGHKGLFSGLRLWLILHRHFFVNYWQIFYFKKIDDDCYKLDFCDHLSGE